MSTETLFKITLSILVLFILVLSVSHQIRKEDYPGVGALSKFNPEQHYDETNLTQAEDVLGAIRARYNIEFVRPPSVFDGKFNKGFCMLLYVIISNMYIKELSWDKLTKKSSRNPYETNKLLWQVGAAEYLTSKEEGGFLDDTVKRIDKKMSICNNEIFDWREGGAQPSYGCMPQDVDIMGAQRTRIINVLQNDSIKHNAVLNFIFSEIRQINPVNQDILGEIDFVNVFGGPSNWRKNLAKKSITARTSPDVYNMNNSNDRNYLTSTPRVRSVLANPVDLVLYDWVENFGLCTDTAPIDYGQPIVRTIASVYKSKLANTYIVCVRGIVYEEEMSVAFKAEPTLLSNNREVHTGFYNLFTNKPVKYGDSNFIDTPYDIVNGVNIFNTQRPGFNRNEMYTLYEQKGSLQDQWRRFLDGLSANKETDIILCGHSMGAGLAQMMIVDMLESNRSSYIDTMTVYLLNSPRCINVDAMRDITTSLDGRIYDVQNTDDFLTSLPITYLEPAALTKSIYIEVDNDWDYRNLTYIDQGWHYAHFTNTIGYNYNVDDFKDNHFMESADYGIDRLFDIIYTPTFDKTTDIIFNGIYQSLLNQNQVPRSIEGRSGCFIGTSNPSYWNREDMYCDCIAV